MVDPEERASGREVVAEHLLWQAGWCERLGSQFYAELLGRAAEDAEAGGAAWEVLEGQEADPKNSYAALALRLLGSVHRLVLEGRVPELAKHYPSVGGEPGDAWPPFREVLREHGHVLRRLIARPVQTNEVGRSASLLGGFLTVARETGLPLRLLEIGASAGLNLRWDRYRYESAGWSWGDPASPVRFTDVFEDAAPEAVAGVVTERVGCDLAPVDPTTEEGRITLLSYVWPDQAERLERLRGALEVARTVPATVERADAAVWLEGRLAEPVQGAATIVFHSIVFFYLDDAGRARVRSLLEQAGERATPHAPVAWLFLEMEEERFVVRLRFWPGGEDRPLATSTAHGPPIQWLG
jgi:hypothetical protein